MKRIEPYPLQSRAAAEAERKQVIARAMRFVLQKDAWRFSGELTAYLLDEGCNLHPELARAIFYEHFERRLAPALPADLCRRLCEETADSAGGRTHPQYHAMAKTFRDRLSDAETQITAAVLDVVGELKLLWQQTAEENLDAIAFENAGLETLIGRISRVNPAGRLARHGLERVRRRLKIAVAASLLRHVRNPDALREKYGSVPQLLRDIGRNPAVFSAVMAFLAQQVPYARHVTAQSFWRTLNNLDKELPEPTAGIRKNGG